MAVGIILKTALRRSSKRPKVLRERSLALDMPKIVYLERERVRPFIAQFGACLDAPTVKSLDRLQLGACLDVPITMSMSRRLTLPCP